MLSLSLRYLRNLSVSPLRKRLPSRSSRKSSDALSSEASCSGYALENRVSKRSPKILGLSSGNIFKLSSSS